MKRKLTKYSCPFLIAVAFGLGPAWEARSETAPAAEKPKFFENVSKMFVWKPDKPSEDSKKAEKENASSSIAKPEKPAEVSSPTGREDPEADKKKPFQFLPGFGKKNQTDESAGSADREKKAPAPLAGEEASEQTAKPDSPYEKADGKSSAGKRFSLFGGSKKKEKRVTSPESGTTAEEGAESSTATPIPAEPSPEADVSLAQEPAVVAPEKKKKDTEKVNREASKTKSFRLFGKRKNEEAVLPDVYEGLSGDEALELAMKRAKAKLEAQGTPAPAGAAASPEMPGDGR